MVLKVLEEEENDILILDEINVAMQLGFLKTERVIEMINNKPKNTELILTGRGCPEEIMNVADYVTELKPHKHPFDTKGTPARRGIEY